MYETNWLSLSTLYLMLQTAYENTFRYLLQVGFNMLAWTHFQALPSHISEETITIKTKPRDLNHNSREFLDKVERAFSHSMKEKSLLLCSNQLKNQFLERLQDPSCMLPTFNHKLPSGEETGTFIALDLGGSTLRVALVKLTGKRENGSGFEISSLKTVKITSDVKTLSGHLFFDWIAGRIEETLLEQNYSASTFSMGISWSFPIEQTSHRNGLLMNMGKGFSAADILLKQDLRDLIRDSCQKRGLVVNLDAITNDSTATLLSKAYTDTTTQFSLILGTGVNAAINLPTRLFAASKFGCRSPEWHASAEQVIVNTELSMMGKDSLPVTEWDKKLMALHPNPNFQPFELMVSGRYLGEIIRLVLVDGIETAGLFDGIVPPSLREMYSLDTETISQIESDQSSTQQKAGQILHEKHPSLVAPTRKDMLALRFISSHVIYRASSLVAAAIHSLWQLCNEVRSISSEDYSKTLVACNGSVIEYYPGFKVACQSRLDSLVQESGGERGLVKLVIAENSSLLGAAVASAIASS
ncbi:Hexokinase-1 [Golovinomyces cichoracearum]|uniref:Phosphotransferase n=1 Tax=Golovinomyces cichoracearum TaxID=62708 RepID=A0A420IVQ7_9PEZI|nr:Hexokinase-1 [Golovinomyces cichoracearum]